MLPHVVFVVLALGQNPHKTAHARHAIHVTTEREVTGPQHPPPKVELPWVGPDVNSPVSPLNPSEGLEVR
jgi:hypothetical protein